MRPGIVMDSIISVLSARPANVKLEEKKAWIKLEGPTGLRMYVAKQKIVRQIDLAGFGCGWDGTVPPPKHNGAVEACIDLANPNALTVLAEILCVMSAGEVKPTEKPKAARPGKVVSTSSKPARLSDLAEVEKEARMQLIARVAKEKGVSISKDTEAQLLSVETLSE